VFPVVVGGAHLNEGDIAAYQAALDHRSDLAHVTGNDAQPAGGGYVAQCADGPHARQRELLLRLRAQDTGKTGGREGRQMPDLVRLTDQCLNEGGRLAACLTPDHMVARTQKRSKVQPTHIRSVGHYVRHERASANIACARARCGRSSMAPLCPIVPLPGFAANRATIS